MLRSLAAIAAAVLFTTGCGYIGGPQPPLAHIPTRVADVAAVQRGAHIVVQFTVPTLTTESTAIKQPVTLDLRIGVGAAPFTQERWAAQAQQLPQQHDPGGTARYEIPTQPWVGKTVAIAVRVLGANGKHDGWSNFVNVPVIAPPERPHNVHAEVTRAGLRLTWQAAGSHFRVLRSSGTPGDYTVLATVTQPEYLDASIEYGKPYSYLVQTIVPLPDAKEAESDPSEPLRITPAAPPPAAPTGLRAVPAPNSVSIELSWESNAEPDLAGYRIYRAAPGGAFAKIADGSTVPGYSDHAVEHGKTYRYTVTAIDQTGRESPQSEPVEANLP